MQTELVHRRGEGGAVGIDAVLLAFGLAALGVDPVEVAVFAVDALGLGVFVEVKILGRHIGGADVGVERLQRKHQLHVLVPGRADGPHHRHGGIVPVDGHQAGDAALGDDLVDKVRAVQPALGPGGAHVVYHHGNAPAAQRVVLAPGKAGVGVDVLGHVILHQGLGRSVRLRRGRGLRLFRAGKNAAAEQSGAKKRRYGACGQSFHGCSPLR